MLKKVIFYGLSITLLFLFLPAESQRDVFVKQIKFKLERISSVDYENEYFVTMKFTKGLTYKFKILNYIEGFPGEAVLEVLDADNLVITNHLNNQYFEDIQFVCNKTAFYDILIRYKNDKLGNSTIDISMKQ